jgi:hypothetical protein
MPNAGVRDLWSSKDLEQFTEWPYVKIPAHGSMLIEVSGQSGESVDEGCSTFSCAALCDS